jgi:ribosomal protein S18 acetylase RimI-like enzyme
MSPAAYTDYLQIAVAGYAKDNVDAGRWPEDGALARAQADFDLSLPQGLATPDNYLFEIRSAESGPTIGFIWFALEETHGLRHAFVYDIEINPAHRRQGHAMAALQAIEPRVRELGVTGIGLHVFAHNPGAQALYAKLGYNVTSINMRKNLASGPG